MTNELSPAGGRVPVTVVICARNREASVGRCIRSVLQAGPAEIVLVDGRSNDGTARVAREFQVAVISDGGAGLGAARQLGAQVATQEFVVYVDTDAVLLPDTLAVLLEDAHDQGYDAVQARLLPLPDRLTYWQAGETWRRAVQEPSGPASALGCQATLIRRSLAATVKFDRAFEGAAEDGDFFYRARRTGARCGRSSRAVALHEDRPTLLAFVNQRFWHGRGLARMAIRHGRRYLEGATEQASSARVGMRGNLRYMPFMAVSAATLAAGMAVETARIAASPRVRRLLRANG